MLKTYLKASLLAIASVLLTVSSAKAENTGEDRDFTFLSDNLIDDYLRLEEVEVFSNPQDSTAPSKNGIFSFTPRLVVEEGTRRTARHWAYGMVIRPIVETEDGFYRLDRSRGRTNYIINSELPIRSKPDKIAILGSKRFVPTDQERRLKLPEGLYAIAEVYYIVQRGPLRPFNDAIVHNLLGIGATTSFGELPETKRYCLSENTLAFKVNDGSTTSFEKLYVRGLPFKSRQWKDHDPIFGTDTLLAVNDPAGITDEAKWVPIAFDSESGMCPSKTSVRTTGWDIPDRSSFNLPVKYSPDL